MFRIPDLPSPRDDAYVLADFVEIQALRFGHFSLRDLIASLNRLEEYDYSDEVPIDDSVDNLTEEVFNEIALRALRSGNKYPFKLERKSVLSVDGDCNPNVADLYIFLLLATRLNMKTESVRGEIDATKEFEFICAHIVENYFGPASQVLVFGTSKTGECFLNNLRCLCSSWGEYTAPSRYAKTGSSRIKDDGVDIIAWIPFADNAPGKLIAYGQCKTGTHYTESFERLQPDGFNKVWLDRQPAVDPVRFYFIAAGLPRGDFWYRSGVRSGVLFDRFRIMNYSDRALEKRGERISVWTDAARAYAMERYA